MITKDTKILDVVEQNPESVYVFQDHGLGCVGCLFANFETLGEGAAAHGLDVDKLVEDLNNLQNAKTEETVEVKSNPLIEIKIVEIISIEM